MNGYDFDNTIYNGDSSIEFYFFLIRRHPFLFYKLLSFIFSYLLYILHIKDKIYAKEQMFSIFKNIKDIDNEVKFFWNNKELTNWYLDIKEQDDIIISASPLFLIKPFLELNNIKNVIASDVDKNNGKFNGPNCYGEEKVKLFIKKYGKEKLKRFYTDSLSDLHMLDVSEDICIVKNGKLKADFTIKKER